MEMPILYHTHHSKKRLMTIFGQGPGGTKPSMMLGWSEASAARRILGFFWISTRNGGIYSNIMIYNVI